MNDKMIEAGAWKMLGKHLIRIAMIPQDFCLLHASFASLQLIKATATQITKSLFNNTITRELLAPFAFLIPVSFLRRVIE